MTRAVRVMLLIDADNVSVDVMEQALALLLERHGAVHVRRAYCTAESALKHQQTFKRLSIRPMVNLAAGKNSTDIALAVDALDLVLAERPDVVAIASSDSDFAPLVGRLREKGCRVCGIGQDGKTGEETRTVYDEFTVLAHRSGAASRATSARASTGAARAGRARSDAAAPSAPRRGSRASRGAAAGSTPVPREKESMAARATAAGLAAATQPPAPRRSNPPPTRPITDAGSLPEKVVAILAALPELRQGQPVELRLAASRLRDAGLLGPRASSTKFFAPVAPHFELIPAEQPNKVRLRG